MKHEYPKVLYHKTKCPVTVGSKAEQEKLGAAWSEAPVSTPKCGDEPATPGPSKTPEPADPKYIRLSDGKK